MKIRFKITAAGPGIHWQAGEVYDIDPKEAESIVRAGFAEYEPAEVIETAEDIRPQIAEVRVVRGKQKRK